MLATFPPLKTLSARETVFCRRPGRSAGAPGSISTQRRLRPSVSRHCVVWKRTPLASRSRPFFSISATAALDGLRPRLKLGQLLPGVGDFEPLPADQDGAAKSRQHKRAQRRGADDRQRAPGKPRLSLRQNKLRPVERVQACRHRFLRGVGHRLRRLADHGSRALQRRAHFRRHGGFSAGESLRPQLRDLFGESVDLRRKAAAPER